MLGDVQLYSADDSVGNLVISEGFIHGVTNNSGDRVTGIFKQALLLEQLFMCGHKYVCSYDASVQQQECGKGIMLC